MFTEHFSDISNHEETHQKGKFQAGYKEVTGELAITQHHHRTKLEGSAHTLMLIGPPDGGPAT